MGLVGGAKEGKRSWSKRDEMQESISEQKRRRDRHTYSYNDNAFECDPTNYSAISTMMLAVVVFGLCVSEGFK